VRGTITLEIVGRRRDLLHFECLVKKFVSVNNRSTIFSLSNQAMPIRLQVIKEGENYFVHFLLNKLDNVLKFMHGGRFQREY
jgi:hypothetical protein